MKAESKSPEITKRALEVFSEIGLYNEAQYEEYKAVYQNNENRMAEKEGKTARTLSREYIEGEIAADLMCETMGSTEFLEMFAGKISEEDGNVILDFFKKIQKSIEKTFGGNDVVTNKFNSVVKDFEGAIKGKSDKKSSTEVEVRNAASNINKSTSFVEDKYYSRQIDRWGELPENSYVTVGNIGVKSALGGVGIPSGKLYFDVSKIKEGMDDHADHLDAYILKKIPNMLDNPIAITEYNPGTNSNTVSVYGELYVKGKPIVVGIVVTKGRGNNVVSKIRTVHARKDIQNQITDESILYLRENKKEVNAWFQAIGGIHVPLGGTQLGVIRSINLNDIVPHSDGIVKRKFALSSPVEKTSELIAVHNVWSNKLSEALDLGGLPSPSIAVIKAGDEHSKFGDVSFVFGRDTIDPEADKRNKFYGGDAYTPVKPEIAIKIRESAKDRFSKIYYDYQKKFGDDYIRPLYGYANYADEEISRVGGVDEATDRLKRDTTLMQAYLQMQGKKPVEPVVVETETRMSDADVIRSEFFIEQLGEDIVQSVTKPTGMDLSEHLNSYYKKYGDKLRDAYKKYLSEVLGFSSEEISNVMANYQNKDVVKFIVNARNFLSNNGVTVETKEDYAATQDKIREAIKGTGYSEWIDSLFDNIIEKKGIRNNKDLLTPSGNRRSFEELYYEYNLENIVKAMTQGEKKGISIFGGNIFGASTKNYKSVEDARADASRLKTISEEEYGEMRSEFFDRLHDLSSRLAKSESGRSDAEAMLVEAVAKYTTPKGIKNYLERESKGFFNYTDEIGNEFLELVGDIANMPTSYFESKPERAVDFSEVAYAVVPDNLDKGLLDRLREVIADVRTYIAGDNDNRTEVLNSVPEIRFALSGDGVDNEGDSGYNENRRFALVNLDGKKVFPSYEESGSDSNERATRWAHRSDIEDYTQRIFYHEGRRYLVEKDSSLALWYCVLKKVTNKEYAYLRKLNDFKNTTEDVYGRNTDRQQGNVRGVQTYSENREIAESPDRSNGNGGFTDKHNRETPSTQGMGGEQNAERRADIKRERTFERNIKDTQREVKSEDPEKDEGRWALSDNGIYSLEEMMRDRNTAKITSVPLTALR